MTHLETSNEGEILVYPSASHALTPGAIDLLLTFSIDVCADALHDHGGADLMRAGILLRRGHAGRRIGGTAAFVKAFGRLPNMPRRPQAAGIR
jgi:hypothetical protein